MKGGEMDKRHIWNLIYKIKDLMMYRKDSGLKKLDDAIAKYFGFITEFKVIPYSEGTWSLDGEDEVEMTIVRMTIDRKYKSFDIDQQVDVIIEPTVNLSDIDQMITLYKFKITTPEERIDYLNNLLLENKKIMMKLKEEIERKNN